MKILYHSVAPWVATGYGTCTEEIAGRVHNTKTHEVALQPLDSVRKGDIWYHGEDLKYDLKHPMKVYRATGPFGLNSFEDNFEKAEADLLFTHFDTWMRGARNKIPDSEIPYVSYVIVDHQPAPDAVIEQLNNAYETVCMSEYAKMMLEQKGIRPQQIPHGVDTDIYKPLDEELTPTAIKVRDEQGNEREMSLEDNRVFGMVAANHGDRKNIPNHLQAFKRFLNEVDSDAILYVHTDQNAREGYNLDKVRQEIGVPKQNVIWPRDEDYGNVSSEYLNSWYNTFDVMLNCSMGESWGLTITEAQAAGTPCIVTNFSSMPEQLGASATEGIVDGDLNGDIIEHPHGLAVNPTSTVWREKVSSKQFIVDSESIFEAMKYYHNNPDLIKQHGEDAREFVVNNYEWESEVIPQFIKLFDALEAVV